jgi:L-histidine N-alpha-methyltransferase
MEIYLESLIEQTAFIPALDLDVKFKAGERIHTENSYKYTDAMIEAILNESGFQREHTWCDRKKWFGVHLARV